MKNGKILDRLSTNPRVASLVSNDDGTATVTLKTGFINNGVAAATLKNAHAIRLFVRDALGPDGRPARPGRPAKNPAVILELSTGFVDRAIAAGASIGTEIKRNAKKVTLSATSAQTALIRKLANTDAASGNIGLKGSAAAVLRALDA